LARKFLSCGAKPASRLLHRFLYLKYMTRIDVVFMLVLISLFFVSY
jgi:hypothetical protein